MKRSTQVWSVLLFAGVVAWATEAAAQRVIYVNFDGGTFTQGPAPDAANNTVQSGAHVGTWPPYGDGVKREATMQAFRADWEDYGVDIVTERPTAGDYTMLVATPRRETNLDPLGLATVDCGDAIKRDISWAYLGEDDEFSAIVHARVFSQELAHTFGLEHTTVFEDIMFPSNGNGIPDGHFFDACLPIDKARDRCAVEHTRFCPTASEQNGHLELLYLFPPGGPDTTPPQVEFVAPAGGRVQPGLVEVFVDAHDASVIATLELMGPNGSEGVVDELPAEFELTLPHPDGVRLVATAVDIHGNAGSAELILRIGEGDEGSDATGAPPDPSGEDAGEEGSDAAESETGAPTRDTDPAPAGVSDDAEGCACTHARPKFGRGGAMLLVLPVFQLLRRRRRTRA